ncbi:phosphodiester glycosidase family protein [Alkalihalobacillus sp. AL-G]|uniref:phosphodiester glycosidase family protein n=1 Tax=Alkalihalobacillus sp. AL-G TaxID=2926399 RepID=UPI00272A72E0|nr:phosphodiester glycosidase family protein [Alkalihalobacillus sp. AL-G]WLD94364.1 phosphodiester glycosidase family protein [Alkalihalobacillus sp. AL-G]
MFLKRLLIIMLAVLILVPISPALAKDDVPSSDTPVPQPSIATTTTNETTVYKVIHEEIEETPIAKGVTLMQFNRFDTEGWLRGDVMKVNLSEETLSTNLLTPGNVTDKAPISKQVKESGAIAGVNGDFFDISNTNAPIGLEVSNGELIKSSYAGRMSVSVSDDRIGHIAKAVLEGQVSTSDGTHELDGINHPTVNNNELVLYTSAWGEASRTHLLSGSADFIEVLLKDNKVTQVIEGNIYTQPLLEGEVLLSGKGDAAQFLQNLQVGSTVDITYSTSPAFKNMTFAVGGSSQLVKDGEISTTDNGDRHPRTAVGFSKDGTQMILATVDGRQRDSRGMTLLELAHLMKEHGAWNALNLDGGGSSTLVARELGRGDINVFNSPSDGGERHVPNGIGIWSTAKTGNLDGFQIEANSTRVFKGLSREFEAHAYDTAYAPIEVKAEEVEWHGGEAGSFDGNVFHARQHGKDRIRAKFRGDMTYSDIHVLGEPVELLIEPRQIGLEKGKSTTFMVIGKDEEGYSTYIEPRDVQLQYDENKISIEPNKDGSFTLTALEDGSASLVKAIVGDLETNLGVTVGLRTEMAETFEDTSDPWTFFRWPYEVGGSLEYVSTDKTDGNALKLNYDFTTTTRTRAAYMFPPNRSLPLAGDVKKIGARVYGTEGNGHWLRARIKDSNNVYHVLDLTYSVDWNGWKYVEANVPAGVEYPVILDRIYLVETDRNKQDTGYIMIDDVQTKVAQKLEIPEQEKREDPLILEYGKLPADHWKFAVISDLQLISANEGSKEIKNSKKVLQSLNEQDVDFVLFNGDVVDFDTEEEFQFAKQLIEENLEKPYYVTPGNHETYGTGNLANFKEYFGPDHQVFDHEGTRFILMNTSLGGLRISNPEQWFTIKNALEEAKTDSSINNVFVIGHHPLKDPLPDGAHAIADSKEADLLEKWLTDFREETGKRAMVMAAHAQLVHLDRRDGIPYMITGPIGKGTYGAPDNGGFYNYAVFGVNSNWKPDERLHDPSYQGIGKNIWIQADIRPILEDITVASQSYVVGETTVVNWTGHQAGGWNFPLSYPATIRYQGSNNLLISTTEQTAETGVTAQFNPETQEITFLKPGTISITVQSGDMERTFELSGE